MSWWRGSRDYETFADSVANEARATVRSLKPGALEAHYDRTGVRLEEFNWKCACVLGAMHKHLAKMGVDVMLAETLPPDWVFEDVAERALGAAMTRDFEPNVGRTQGLLAYDFARLPVLRDIPAADRWRLLVDRATVDALDDHGIDTANPLLAFAFDPRTAATAPSPPPRAGLPRCFAEAERPIEPRLIDHLRERCGLKFTAEAKIFGVQIPTARKGAMRKPTMSSTWHAAWASATRSSSASALSRSIPIRQAAIRSSSRRRSDSEEHPGEIS